MRGARGRAGVGRRQAPRTVVAVATPSAELDAPVQPTFGEPEREAESGRGFGEREIVEPEGQRRGLAPCRAVEREATSGERAGEREPDLFGRQADRAAAQRTP